MKNIIAKFPVPKLFLFAGLLMLLVGFLERWFSNNSALDIHLHDTYFVIAHFHVFTFHSIFFFVFAGIYYTFPKVFKRQMNSFISYCHFIVTFAGALLIFAPMHYQGIAGAPRRYYDYSEWESFKYFCGTNLRISTIAFTGLLFQILFLLNLVLSIFFGKRLEATNK